MVLFRILEIDSAFLNMPVKDWEQEPRYRYINGKHVTTHDSEERVFKRHFVFLNTSKIEAGLQRALQVVGRSRTFAKPVQTQARIQETWLLCENEKDYLRNAFIDLSCSFDC